MSMSDEIKNRLEQYIRREQALLNKLLQLKRQRKDVGAKIGRAIIGEGVAALATDLLNPRLQVNLDGKQPKLFIFKITIGHDS